MFSTDKLKSRSYCETISVKIKPTYSKTDKDRITSYLVYFEPLGKKGRKVQLGYKDELTALKIAKKIGYDIDNHEIPLSTFNELSNDEIKDFYNSLNKPNETKLTLIQSIKDSSDSRNIKDIWENYKVIAVVSETTKRKDFKSVDNCLSKLTDNELLLCNVNNLPSALLKHYARGSLVIPLKHIQRSLNVIVNGKLLSNKRASLTDYRLVDLLPQTNETKKTKEFYKPNEVKAILKAFNDAIPNKFCPNDKGNRYYYPYVLFCALTGCRPSEATDLLVSDIKISQGKVQVSITKANGNNHTKNYKVRLIPVCSELAKFLIKYVNGKNKDDLLFPSVYNNKLNHDDFAKDRFKPLVLDLVKQGKVKKYLRPYNLRHSFATNMLRQGVDIATIAGLLGDRIQTVIDYYIGSDYENTDIPDIY